MNNEYRILNVEHTESQGGNQEKHFMAAGNPENIQYRSMLQALIPMAQVYTDLHSFLDLIPLIRVNLRHLRLEIESKIGTNYAKQSQFGG